MSPRTPGAWNGVNGPRILTPEQRQRKRERDRATKREEKIKNQQRLQELEQTKEYATRRIQELEAQVETLQKTCRCRAGNTGGRSQRGSLNHSVTIQCSPSSLVPPSSLPYEESNGSIMASPLHSEYSNDDYSPGYSDFIYESNHPSPLPYRVSTAPQTYTTATHSTPSTWSTTPHTLSASAHPYSSHSSSAEESKSYTAWDSRHSESRSSYSSY
ncbi:hypothetical protein HYFRA_00000874 [Hymenoscyphus fraxineus]|uniref:BZIP domain-containing protein n=1 Tax=Hymenoscyphus fraxineus TaxID=746836 RepID=A0A9N9KRG1_9HELO|nr:hypothetical protein HYFRA_00000874 [Hymenoscyphus fraxineus]